ncbi:MAG: carboxypeptidase-like regulatory domain-containing protein, partial [Pyrinomonadaceae bacterium]
CYKAPTVGPPPLAGTINGQGDLPGNVSATFTVTDDTMPRIHEQGHVMGLKHTDYTGDGTGDESCGNAAGNSVPCTTLEGDGALSLKKDQYDPTTAYGFDINDSSPTKIYPAETADFMSYGRPRWVSRATYTALFNMFRTTGAGVSEILSTASLNTVSATQTVIINGSVRLGGNSGQIGSVYISQTPGTVALPTAGAYAVRFENAQGAQLATYSFDPILGSDDITSGVISLQLPWDISTKRIVLLHNGQILASRQASANSPTVTVTSPNGGETLSGASANFTWTASDLDGDTLTYALEYSSDNGTTWKALAFNWNTTSFPVDLTKLQGSNQAFFRVTASDGFNSAEDQSNAVFIVPSHAPEVSVTTPENNHLYVGDQTIILNGMGFDSEDGMLASSRLSWSSNLNGALGTGSPLAISASTLQEGTHTITLSATDSTMQLGSSSISIRVFRTRPVFPAALSVGPSGLLFNANLGSVQTSSQAIAIRNSGDGDLTWSATADKPWIQLALENGIAPSNAEVSINPDGLAVGNYSGIITFTAANAANSPLVVNVELIVSPSATVSGRVLTPTGLGLRNARVIITDSQGVSRSAVTSSFGFFSFADVATGNTYTISISSKRYRFAARTLQVVNDITLPDFIGLE